MACCRLMTLQALLAAEKAKTVSIPSMLRTKPCCCYSCYHRFSKAKLAGWLANLAYVDLTHRHDWAFYKAANE